LEDRGFEVVAGYEKFEAAASRRLGRLPS